MATKGENKVKRTKLLSIPQQKNFLFDTWAKVKRTMSELWAKDKLPITNPPISVKRSKNSVFFYF